MSLSPEQQEIRKKGVGGSEMGAILGLSPFVTFDQVLAQKRGEAEPFVGNRYTKAGDLLEDDTAELYRRQVPMVAMATHGATIVHSEAPMVCTPDRIVVDLITWGVWGWEGKSTSYTQRSKWGETGSLKVPRHYAVQVHHYMAVTGLTRWDMAVLIGGNDFRWYSFRKQEGMDPALEAVATWFWSLVHGEVGCYKQPGAAIEHILGVVNQ